MFLNSINFRRKLEKLTVGAFLHTGRSLRRKAPQDGKTRSSSSTEWLTRQLNDQYVKWAKYKNYRARSAFKLIEIDDKNSFLKPGCVVVECGAAPGAWTQVVVERINADQKVAESPIGKIVALDLQGIEPIPGAIILSNMDATLPSTRQKILQVLAGASVDVLLSDMAPNATGVRQLDHDNSTMLAYSAMQLALQTLRVGGTCLLKLFDGGNRKQIENDLNKYFQLVKIIKPHASRKDSSELYLLAQEFRGAICN